MATIVASDMNTFMSVSFETPKSVPSKAWKAPTTVVGGWACTESAAAWRSASIIGY